MINKSQTFKSLLENGMYYSGTKYDAQMYQNAASINSSEKFLFSTEEIKDSKATIIAEHSSCTLDFFKKQADFIERFDELIIQEKSAQKSSFHFQFLGNFLNGNSKGIPFLTKTLYLEQAYIHKPHFFQKVLSRLFFRYGIISIKANMPISSPYSSLFSKKKELTTFFLRLPSKNQVQKNNWPKFHHIFPKDFFMENS